MPAESVKLNSGDNKSQVAYDMALSLWRASHRNSKPNMDEKSAFLDLVQDCARALEPGSHFEYSGEKTEGQ